MPIIMIENRYPVNKNNEVVTTWLSALEKHPRPEGLFTPLVESAVSSDLNGLKVLSAYQPAPGKYEETAAYLGKFMTEFFGIDGYAYQFSTWSTIEEAMELIGQTAPAR